MVRSVPWCLACSLDSVCSTGSSFTLVPLASFGRVCKGQHCPFFGSYKVSDILMAVSVGSFIICVCLNTYVYISVKHNKTLLKLIIDLN